MSQVKEYKKGLYVDGHERDDVVQDRQKRFIPEMEELIKESVWVTEGEDGSLELCNIDAKYLLISMDQKAHKSNERPTWFWADEEMSGLPPKVTSSSLNAP